MSLAIDEEHMVEAVVRFEAQDERRVPMTLKNNRGRERRFDAVRVPVSHDSAKTSQRRPGRRQLVVIWQYIEKALHLPGCPETGHESGFAGSQSWLRAHIDSACVVVERVGRRGNPVHCEV